MRQRQTLLLRPSTDADLPAITAIYGDAVLHGTGTFELEPPDAVEIGRRRADVLVNGLPYLVAQASDGQAQGYAYANQFRPRPGYRFTLEDSVYVRPQAQGQGLGKLLLNEFLARCEARGARQMLALIGDSTNLASIRLHAALGFSHAGLLKSVGWKFGRWCDVVLMQRAIGAIGAIGALGALRAGDARTPTP